MSGRAVYNATMQRSLYRHASRPTSHAEAFRHAVQRDVERIEQLHEIKLCVTQPVWRAYAETHDKARFMGAVTDALLVPLVRRQIRPGDTVTLNLAARGGMSLEWTKTVTHHETVVADEHPPKRTPLQRIAAFFSSCC